MPPPGSSGSHEPSSSEGVGALAGCIVWLFNTRLLLSNYHPNRIANLVWLPLMFAVGDRVAAGGSPVAMAALALLVAVQVTAGYPEFTVNCGLLLAVCYLASSLGRASTVSVVRGVLSLFLAFVVGSLATGLQLLPLAEIATFSQRAVRAGSEITDLPQHFPRARFFLNIPLGVAGLLGIAAGAFRRRRVVAPLVGLLTCSVVVDAGWLYLRQVPGWSFMRHPFSWMYASQFFIAWLVAVGADEVWDRAGPDKGGFLPRVLVGLGGLTWTSICVARVLLPPGWWRETIEPAFGTMLRQSLEAAGPAGTLGPASVLGAAGGLLLAYAAIARGPLSRGAAMTAVTTIAAAHISAFPFATPLARLEPPDTPFRAASVLGPERAAEGRVLSLQDPRSGLSLLDRVENVTGVEGAFLSPRFRTVRDRLGVDILRNRVDWTALAAAPGYLDSLDVRFVLAPSNVAAQLASAGLSATGERIGTVAVFQNAEAPGRAWVTYGVKPVSSAEAALDGLLSPDFDPRRQVILELPTQRAYPELATRAHTPARVTYPEPTVANIEVELPEPGGTGPGRLLLSWLDGRGRRPAQPTCCAPTTSSVPSSFPQDRTSCDSSIDPPPCAGVGCLR